MTERARKRAMGPYCGRSLFWEEFRGRGKEGDGRGEEGSGFRMFFFGLLRKFSSSVSSAFIRTPELSLTLPQFLNLVLYFCKILNNLCHNYNDNNNEHRIGILVQKGFVFVALVWASLVVGLPFLPLDPSTPLPFLKRVLSRAGVSVCFVAGADGIGAEMIDMVDTVFIPVGEVRREGDPRVLGGREREGMQFIQNLGLFFFFSLPISSNPLPFPAPLPDDNWAYILTTSGTTGEPKVVPIATYSLLNRLNWFISRFNVNKSDVFVFKTPVTFDVSVWEYVVPLMTGLIFQSFSPIFLTLRTKCSRH